MTTKTVAEKAKARRLNVAGAAKKGAAAPDANAEWNFPTVGQMAKAKEVPAAPKADPKPADPPKAADPAPTKPVVGKRTRKPAPVTKPAADKGEGKAKPTVQAVEFIVRKAKPGQTITVLSDVKVGGARPTKGTALYAHTHAALTILGLLDKGETKMGTLLSVIGRTAVTHHLSKDNLKQVKGDMVKLSDAGLTHFKDRNIDNALANAYVALFLDGKIGKELGTLRPGQTFKIAV